MPSQRPPSAGSRGPLRRDPVARPSGYRLTDQVRRELQMAASFKDCSSLQAVIDLAVAEFLARLNKSPGFRDAFAKAEQSRRRHP